MDTGIIISLILGGASIISSIFYGYIPARQKEKMNRLEKKVRTLALDIDFLYTIESNLLEELSIKTQKKAETLKKEFRNKVMKEKGRYLSNYSKPSETAKLIDNH